MKKVFKFLKTTFLGGALVVLPVWVATLLVFKVLQQMRAILKPVSSTLPEFVDHPQAFALIVLVAVCFLVGVIIRTVAGRRAKKVVERNVFEHIPGYTTLRNVGEQMADMEHEHGFKPALVEMENGLAPGFIVEELPNGFRTVFIPSAPTPAAGTILILEPSRVHPVDVSVTKVFKCVTKWGTGAGTMLEAMHPETSQEREMNRVVPQNRMP